MSENAKKVNEVHLGYIQSTITRMGQNSFQAKAWCISAVAALLAFYISQDELSANVISVVISIVATLFFGVIDVYYLYLERGYRYLYNIVARINSNEVTENYDMKIPRSQRGFWKFLKAFLSPSTGLFYGTIIIFQIALILTCNKGEV